MNKTIVYMARVENATARWRAEEVTLESPHTAKGAREAVEFRIGGCR